MSTLNLMLSEMRFRWLNSLLTLLAIAAAGTLFVGGPMLIDGYRTQLAGELTEKEEELSAELDKMQANTDRELAELDKKTKRQMRDLGFNVRIVHEDTDMSDFYGEFKAADMPEEYVHRLGDSTGIDKIRHIVATLQEKYRWNGRTVLLVGILPSVTQSHLEKKPPMGYRIPEGSVFLGSELAGDYKQGDKITLGEREFTVAEILPAKGTIEDISLALHLHDAQKVLGKGGKVNQIVALNCQCEFERLSEIRAQIETVLTDTKVTEDSTKAIARAEQRELVAQKRKTLLDSTKAEHADILTRQQQSNADVIGGLLAMFNVVAPLVVLACALWIGLLAWNNVRERRPEIGILRALGKGRGAIASLFLGKALLLGLIGGLIGCVVGFVLAASFSGAALSAAAGWLIATLLGAPLVALMATYLPALVAIGQDPAIVLRDQ